MAGRWMFMVNLRCLEAKHSERQLGTGLDRPDQQDGHLGLF